MAAFRGVYLCILSCIAIYSLNLDSAAGGESVSECNKPWYISLNENLTVSWTGEDRDATVTAVIMTKDVYDRSCDSSVTLSKAFAVRLFKLSNPCSNSLYIVTITLECGGIIRSRQNLTVRTPPEAPTIKSMKPTNTSIEVTWSVPPGRIEMYRVTLEGGRRNSKAMVKETQNTLWTFSNLDPYTEYKATVSAKNEDHWGKKSAELYVKTLEGVPFEPENVNATEITSDKMLLKWDAPEPNTGDILQYEIVWFEDKVGDSLKNTSVTTSYVIENLFPFTIYHVRVAAVNSAGRGPFASLIETTKLAAPDPPALELLNKSTTYISVKWTLSNSYRGPDPSYSLQWKAKNSDKYDKENIYETSKEGQFNITRLKPFTTYAIQIRGRNDAGFGRWSKILEANTPTGIPSVPRNLRVSSKSATHVELTWDAPEPANGIIINYDFLRRAELKYSSQMIDAHGNNSNFWTAAGLTPYTDYNFTVRARTKAGWGRWTPSLPVRTDVGIPSEPLKLIETKVTNTSIHVRWMAPQFKNGPHVSYVLQWMEINENLDDYYNDVENGTSRPHQLNSKDVDATSYKIKNLNPFTNYSIQVCAKTSAGRGKFSGPIVVQTTAGLSSPPTALEIINIQSTALTVQWSAPESTNGPLKGYIIHWGVKETAGSYVQTTSTSYDALGLRPYTEYFFTVAAETEIGKGNHATVYPITGIATPGVPRNLMTVSVKDHTIVIYWTIPEHPNAPFVQYTVVWNVVSGDNSTKVTNMTACRMRELEPDKNYSIRVRASSDAGDGPWSETLYVRTKQKDYSSAVITGSVVGSILLLLAIVCAILFFYAKRNGGLKSMMQSKPEVKSSETLQTTISVPLEPVCNFGKVPIENFDAHVLKLMSNGFFKLAQEFEKLGKESPGFPANEAKKNENLTKNRWVKILPFDYSRVKLRPVGDEVEPDFINASYVPGDSYLLEYIATQGPLPNTVNDFWRMVWQESVFLIVMLTQCTERAKKTCEKYWPQSGSTNKYGDLDVHTLSESITPAYIQRLFLVTQDGKQRHVVHLHYMSWPVSGCPKSPDDFLTFVKTVRSQVACGVTGPMLVHCSAGIGRTGTFITVDRLYQQMTRECTEVDVYGTVLDMRRFRANLVQTEEQYYFIHLCLQRIIQEKKQEIDEDYGGGIYSN